MLYICPIWSAYNYFLKINQKYFLIRVCISVRTSLYQFRNIYFSFFTVNFYTFPTVKNYLQDIRKNGISGDTAVAQGGGTHWYISGQMNVASHAPILASATQQKAKW